MERLELTVSRLRLPRALARREPYFVALAVPQFGVATDVRTVPFPRVNRSHDLVFDPPFVLLSVPDPGSKVAISVAIMESDAGFRAAGARVDAALEKLKRGSVGHLLTKGSAVSSLGAALQVAAGLIGAVAKYLSRNGDDLLGTLELSVDVPLIENGRRGKFSSSFAELEYGISISRATPLAADEDGANRLTVATPSQVEPLSLEELASAVRIGEDLRAQKAAITKTFGIPEALIRDHWTGIRDSIVGAADSASSSEEKPATATDFADLSDAEIDARADVEEPPAALQDGGLQTEEHAPAPARKPGFLGRRHRK